MTTSTRRKFVKNTLGVPFTTENFPYNNDGDDKKVITINRVLGTGDIGTEAGQTGHDLGAIVDIIPSGSNVLMVEGLTYRPVAVVSGSTPISLMDNSKIGAAFSEISYLLGTDNTVRVKDISTGGEAQLDNGDIVIIKVTIGTSEDSSDVMNP